MDDDVRPRLPARRAAALLTAPVLLAALAATTSAGASSAAPPVTTRTTALDPSLLEAIHRGPGGSRLAPTAADAAATDVTRGPSRVRVGLRLRPVGSSHGRTVSDATRLTPLPSADRPAAVLLGAVAGSRRAAFLVSGQATTWGEGACTSASAGCRVLELAVGRTELLDLPSSTGGVGRYALTVTSIQRVRDASRRTTLRRERRRSAAGVRIVRRAVRAGDVTLSGYRWSARDGLVSTRAQPPADAG